MTEKQFQAILSPISRLEAVSEQKNETLSNIEMLTVDVKKASEQTYKELKNHTALLTDIKELLKEAVKNNGGNTGEVPKVKLPGIISGIGAGLAIITMAAALVAAAGILGIMPNVTPSQLLTAIAVAGVMVLLAPVFEEILHTLSGGGALRMLVLGGAMGPGGFANPMSMLKSAGVVVAAMVGMSLAITLSSVLLSLIVVPSLPQLGAAALIGIALLPASKAFGSIVKNLQGSIGLNKKGMADIGMAALALVTIAGSMVASAYVFQLLPTNQAAPELGFTLRAGVAIALFAFGYSKILQHIKGKKLKDIIFASLAIPAIALAIVGVANVFKLMPDTNTAPELGFTLRAAAAIGLFAFGFTKILKIIQGKSIKDIMFAALAIPFIAIAIVGVAYIFSMLPDVYKTVPAEWSLKTGLAILLFSVSVAIVGLLTKSLGVPTMLMGVLGSVLIATAILGVAWILSYMPSEELNAPPIGWTLSIALALVLFSIPIAIIGAIAMSGAGAVAILAGVVGMIVIASGIWAVAWIFSKMPDISGVAKMLTTSLLAPVNGIVDVLARLKNEVGVENLLPLAGGIIAISGSLLTLAAASAGAAAAGLGSSLMNAGKAFIDFVSGEDTKGPLEILSEIINMAPQIAKVAAPIKILGEAFAFIQGGQNMEVLVRFFEIMQKDPKASNVKAIQDISNPMVKMVNALSNLPEDAPQRLQDLFSRVSWSAIMAPVASIASSMAVIALEAGSAGSNIESLSVGIERMVKSLNSLAGISIDKIIELYNGVNWSTLVDPIDSISISIKRMSEGAIETGSGMKMAANALQLMTSIPIELLSEITRVFNALAKDPLTAQGQSTSIIAKSISAISTSMLTMRSGAFIDMFKVMANSSQAVLAISNPMSKIANAIHKISGVDPIGMDYATLLTQQLAKSSLDSQATALEKMAKSYSSISGSSNSMDVEAINATSDMFKALAYLYQNGKRNAIEDLGDKLIDAVQELASMIADFDTTVGQQNQGSKTVGEAIAKAADNLAAITGLGGGGTGTAQSASGQDAAMVMQELVDLLQTGQAKITITDIDQMAADKI